MRKWHNLRWSKRSIYYQHKTYFVQKYISHRNTTRLTSFYVFLYSFSSRMLPSEVLSSKFEKKSRQTQLTVTEVIAFPFWKYFPRNFGEEINWHWVKEDGRRANYKKIGKLYVSCWRRRKRSRNKTLQDVWKWLK